MENNQQNEFESLGSIFVSQRKVQVKKPPAYPWQDLALRIMKELAVPNFKRSSVFKICRDLPKEFIERCITDTKELCKSGEKWKYFFKVVSEESKRSQGETRTKGAK